MKKKRNWRVIFFFGWLEMFGLAVCDPPEFQLCIGDSVAEVCSEMCIRLSTPEDFTTVKEIENYLAELNANSSSSFFWVTLFEF